MYPLLPTATAALIALTAAAQLLHGDEFRGAALRVLRKQRGMSGAELARRADLSRPYVVQIERGERRAPEQTWQRLLDAVEASKEELDDVVRRINEEQARRAADGQRKSATESADRKRAAERNETAAMSKAESQAMAFASQHQPVTAAMEADGTRLLEGLVQRAARLQPQELRLLLAFCEGLEARDRLGSGASSPK